MEHQFEKQGRPLAVITGASSGIGYELAKVFTRNHFDLLVVAEDPSIADAGNAFRALGSEVKTVQANLATYDGVEKVYSEIVKLGRPVEALALNAGVGVGGKFVDINLEEELNLIQLNIVSSIHLAKRVLKDMVALNRGKILFTSSLAAEMPGPYYAVYAASKSFIQSFAEAIGVELAETAITVTALQPGATDTEFFSRAGMLDTDAGQGKKDAPATVAAQGFHAMMKGDDHVVAGSFKNKVQAMVGKLVSEKTGAKLQGKSVEPHAKGRSHE